MWEWEEAGTSLDNLFEWKDVVGRVKMAEVDCGICLTPIMY